MAARDVIELLGRIGVWDVIVPFIIVFTLVFAMLERTKVLGKEKDKPKTRLNAMVAFVMGFFVIALTDTLKAINLLSQYLVVVIVAGLMLMILLSFFGVRKLETSNFIKWAALILVFGGGLYILGLLNWINQAAVMRWIASPVTAIIVFLIIMYFVFKPAKKK